MLQVTSRVQLQMLRLKASHDVGKRDHATLALPIRPLVADDTLLFSKAQYLWTDR
jgi:hypothetical protein